MSIRLGKGSIAPDFTYDNPYETSLSFYARPAPKRTVLFFLRYQGCPVCQMTMGNLTREHRRYADAGCSVMVVLQSDASIVRDSLAGGKTPYAIACDPAGKIYSLYGVTARGILGYIAPAALVQAIRAVREGYKHGKSEGFEMQRPAVFLVGADNSIQYCYYGRHIADLPSHEKILYSLR
jgi:thioredoxin-dependent peroxiredoxin